MIKLKSEREIHLMRQAGAVAAQAMELVGKRLLCRGAAVGGSYRTKLF